MFRNRTSRGLTPGFTLLETIIGLTVMSIAILALSSLLKPMSTLVTVEGSSSQAQETVRVAMDQIEHALVHANQITIASSTFVQFTCDIDQSPHYNPSAYGTDTASPQAIQNYLNPDRDGDANAIVMSSASWTVGYNLKDDDEDGDGKIDVQKRIYFSGGKLWMDMSVNEGATAGEGWGGKYLKQLKIDVSTFTLTYFGSVQTSMGFNLDNATNQNGVVDVSEMDLAPPNTRPFYGNGVLDSAAELQYVTQVHVVLGMDYKGSKASNLYKVENDVYPPLMPLKAISW